MTYRFTELQPLQLQTLLEAGQELAVLDVRENGIFAQGHLLLASSAPFWRLELLIDALVPRRSTPLVLVGDNDIERHAARKLARLGYLDVRLLAGGISAWEGAGLSLYSGTNVLGKAFGEVLEHRLATPHIEADELKRRLDNGERLVVVDSRTSEEFTDFSIEGAYSLPGAELVYRIDEILADDETLVVVNCAGRTRSIVGAQTLINAGLPNPVVSLKDGTMAWLMNGDTLQHGRHSVAPLPAGHNLQRAQQRAQTMATRARVKALDDAQLAALEQDATRTVFLFDIRSREEYLAGHLPGWRWAVGGQLVQASDEFIGVRGAAVVLADWDGVRALTTAAWLAQLGFEVYTWPVPTHPPLLETGEPARHVPQAYAHRVQWLSPDQLHTLLGNADIRLVDIDSSVAFVSKHVAGATFVAPSQLPGYLQQLPRGSTAVLLSADGVLAASVARELTERQLPAVQVLLGGSAQWFAQGLPSERGYDGILTGEQDTWHGPYVFRSEQERNDKFRAYLDWEVDLATRLEAERGLGIDLSGSLTSAAPGSAV